MPNLTIDPKPHPLISNDQISVNSSSHHFSQSILIGILIFILLSATAYAAYWYGQSVMTTKLAPSIPSATEKVSSFSNVPSPKPAQSRLTKRWGWKIYTSPNRYSVKYPPTAVLNKQLSNDLIEFEIKENNISITFWPIALPDGGPGVDGYLDKINEGLGPKVVDRKVYGTTVDGVPAYRREDSQAGRPSFRVVVPLWRGFLEIRSNYTDDDVNIDKLKSYYDQILSTFKFL